MKAFDLKATLSALAGIASITLLAIRGTIPGFDAELGILGICGVHTLQRFFAVRKP